MLDISIKDLGKALSSKQKAADFIRKHVTVVEKIDGTKLTLIRNDQPFNPRDYTKNWIVAYKNSIIYPTEFQSLEKRGKEIKDTSIGVSQYKFVHDHLQKVHSGTSSIEPNTEFFIEFVQNKPTVTRDYQRKHGLYLVGYGPTDYVESGGHLTSHSTFQDNPEKLEEYREQLQLNGFPVIFEGNFSTLDNIIQGCESPALADKFVAKSSEFNFGDPSSIVKLVYTVFSELESSLGGKAEGVVIQVGGNELSEKQLFKVLAADQHNLEARGEKKSRFRGTPEEEGRYWKEISDLVNELLDQITPGNPDEMMEQLSRKVYSMRDISIAHSKKSLLNIQEDIIFNAKYRLFGTGAHRAKNIAVIPIAAKPFHRGHDSLLRSAIADGNESIIVYVSTGGREEISHSDMIPLWKNFYLPGIKETYGSKIIVRFSDGPMREAMLDAIDLVNRNNAKVSLYGDLNDAEERVNSILDKKPELKGKIIARGVSRDMTGGISGTQMRQYLKDDDKDLFVDGLPPWLSKDSKNKIWSVLSTKI